jgi:hypothetical protein
MISYLFDRIEESKVGSFLGIGCLKNSIAWNSKLERVPLKH